MIRGWDYGAYRGLGPNYGERILEANVRQDMAILRGLCDPLVFRCVIRTYGSDLDQDIIVNIAREFGFEVWAGVWLDVWGKNRLEMDLALASNPDVMVVGNQYVYRQCTTTPYVESRCNAARNETGAFIEEAKAQGFQVAYAGRVEDFALFPQLVSLVDYAIVHVHAFWTSCEISEAAEIAWSQFNALRNIEGPTWVFGESTWPSDGCEVCTLENQERFFDEYLSNPWAAKTHILLFEAFDEAWKWGPRGGDQWACGGPASGASAGTFFADRSGKPVLSIIRSYFLNVTVYENLPECPIVANDYCADATAKMDAFRIGDTQVDRVSTPDFEGFVITIEVSDMQSILLSAVIEGPPSLPLMLGREHPNVIFDSSVDQTYDFNLWKFSTVECPGGFRNSHWTCERKPGTLLGCEDSLHLTGTFSYEEMESVFGIDTWENGHSLTAQFSVCMSLAKETVSGGIQSVCYPVSLFVESLSIPVNNTVQTISTARTVFVDLTGRVVFEGEAVLPSNYLWSGARGVDLPLNRAEFEFMGATCQDNFGVNDAVLCTFVGRSPTPIMMEEPVIGKWGIEVDIPEANLVSYRLEFPYRIDRQMGTSTFKAPVYHYFGIDASRLSEQVDSPIGPYNQYVWVEVLTYDSQYYDLISYGEAEVWLSLPGSPRILLKEGNHYEMLPGDEETKLEVAADPGLDHTKLRIVSRIVFQDNFPTVPGTRVIMRRNNIQVRHVVVPAGRRTTVDRIAVIGVSVARWETQGGDEQGSDERRVCGSDCVVIVVLSALLVGVCLVAGVCSVACVLHKLKKKRQGRSATVESEMKSAAL